MIGDQESFPNIVRQANRLLKQYEEQLLEWRKEWNNDPETLRMLRTMIDESREVRGALRVWLKVTRPKKPDRKKQFIPKIVNFRRKDS